MYSPFCLCVITSYGSVYFDSVAFCEVDLGDAGSCRVRGGNVICFRLFYLLNFDKYVINYKEYRVVPNCAVLYG